MANNDNSTMRRTSRGSKRRSERNILTFYEKIAVIRYYNETNISRNSLAKMFHCCATQIRRILDRKEELLQQLATLSEADASIIIEEMTRKRRKFEMCAVSFILHQWVERCRQLRLRKVITNQTLKDTALKMAAILNLPTFRPSYRWLNRFRGKYKYNEQDLGANGENAVTGELSVEDVIIEFKDSLPSFMQKEISAITSLTKVDDLVAQLTQPDLAFSVNENKKENEKENDNDNDNENSKDFDISGEDDDIDEEDLLDTVDKGLSGTHSAFGDGTNDAYASARIGPGTSAGTTALLSSVFPHLAVIHQFALLNSDVRALELISQLGVHMQTQAAEGAYKQMSLENPDNIVATDSIQEAFPVDLDDIILIE